MSTAIQAKKKTVARSAAKKTRSSTKPDSKKTATAKTQKQLTRELKQTRFLAAYGITACVSHAADAAKVSRKLHYAWLQEDLTYPARFAVAHEEAVQVLEAEARRRAIQGMRRFKFHNGKPVMVTNQATGELEHYFEEERSDLLLIFLLKSARPEKYRDNFSALIEHSGQVGLQVSGVLAVDHPATSSRDWEAKQ